MRPLSTRWPSFASSAGRTDSEPIIATATISIAPTAIDVKTALPVNSIPAIAISTVRPETSTACPEVPRRPQQRVARREPAPPLLALAPQVEERVVDADRHADQQDHRLRRVAGRDEWLASAESPIDASTPENASSTGRPAATSAPNATSRITSVTGSDEYSARWKSLFSVLFSSWSSSRSRTRRR